jgi:hypothetical protein
MQDFAKLGAETVKRLLETPERFNDYAYLEAAEVVLVDEQPGLLMRWTQSTMDQGVRSFGLLMTVEEIVAAVPHDRSRPATPSDLVADLGLLVVEPHGTTAGRRQRTWLRSLG